MQIASSRPTLGNCKDAIRARDVVESYNKYDVRLVSPVGIIPTGKRNCTDIESILLQIPISRILLLNKHPSSLPNRIHYRHLFRKLESVGGRRPPREPRKGARVTDEIGRFETK